MSSTQASRKERYSGVDGDALVAQGRDALLRAIELHELEVHRLEVALKDRKAKMASLRAAVDALETGTSANTIAATFPTQGIAHRMRERKSSVAWQVRREAFFYIERCGRPVKREELYQFLSTKIDFKTDNPLGAISQIMSRAKEFTKLNGGYWLTDTGHVKQG